MTSSSEHEANSTYVWDIDKVIEFRIGYSNCISGLEALVDRLQAFETPWIADCSDEDRGQRVKWGIAIRLQCSYSIRECKALVDQLDEIMTRKIYYKQTGLLGEILRRQSLSIEHARNVETIVRVIFTSDQNNCDAEQCTGDHENVMSSFCYTCHSMFCENCWEQTIENDYESLCECCTKTKVVHFGEWAPEPDPKIVQELEMRIERIVQDLGTMDISAARLDKRKTKRSRVHSLETDSEDGGIFT